MINSFESLLELERETQILDYVFAYNDMPLWFYIRASFYQDIINKHLKHSDPHQSAKLTVGEKIKYLWAVVSRSPLQAKKKDIYMFTSSVLNQQTADGYVNKLYDPLYEVFPHRTQVLEKLAKKKVIKGRKNTTTCHSDLFDVIPSLWARLRGVSREDLRTIEAFITYIKSRSAGFMVDNDDAYWEEVKNELCFMSSYIVLSSKIYNAFFKFKKPKVVLLLAASYGRYLHLSPIFKAKGIRFVEYQHGFVSKGHRAYNLHKNLIALPVTREFYPEYFLTFGQFWSDNVRIPSQKLAIGRPTIASQDQINVNVSEKVILVVSGGTRPQSVVAVVRHAQAVFGSQYKIMLRLHPAETSLANEVYKGLEVSIDEGGLDSSLGMAAYVLGCELSTVLYEALLFTKKVYLYKGKDAAFFLAPEIFPGFQSDEELRQLSQTNQTVKSEIDYFWQQDFQYNYREVMEKILA